MIDFCSCHLTVTFGFLYDIKNLEKCEKKDVFKECMDLQLALASENEDSTDIS